MESSSSTGGNAVQNMQMQPQPEQNPELGFGPATSPSAPNSTLIAPSSEQALAQQFQNVGLDEQDEQGDGLYKGGLQAASSDGGAHPLRPHAEDCGFYLRTGTCKFGLNCRFNHPAKRGGKEEVKENESEGLPGKSSKIKCRYFSTAGGCKYGDACKYDHSEENTDIAESDINFVGLPIRLGERKCPFYMRTGSCGYGTNCKFHHPDPTAINGSDSYDTTSNHQSGNQNVEYVLPLVGKKSQPTAVLASFHMPMDTAIPYYDNCSSYLSVVHSLPEGADLKSTWNGYQAPIYIHGTAGHTHSAPEMSKEPRRTDTSFNHHHEVQDNEFPERPGQPECVHFLKTGDCKFKSSCWYHHPKERASKSSVAYSSDKGLPLRPGRKICWHYVKSGACKYGSNCKFDHPVDIGSNSIAFGGTGMAAFGGNLALT